MKFFELIKKHKTISIVAGLFLFILLTSLFNSKKPSENKNFDQTEIEQNNTSETINLKDRISPIPTSEPFDVTNSDPEYPLKPFLPYKGDGFIIEGYIAPLVLSVKVNSKSDINKTQSLLKKWLVNKELIPGENKIIWNYN